MKKIFLLNFLIFILKTSTVFSQNGTAEGSHKTFEEMRNDDFTKLIGANTGINLSYNKDKSEASGKAALWSTNITQLDIAGKIGTTTNISSLFNDKILPAFEVDASFNILINTKKWHLSTWYYDNTFSANYPALKALTGANKSTASSISTGTKKFKYRSSMVDKISRNKITSTDLLYTFKKFTWLSIQGEYENEKYSFIDDNRIFSKQLYDTTFGSPAVKASINTYWFWNKTDVKWHFYRPNFFYVSAYIKYGNTNNIENLKKVNINDVSKSIVDTATKTTRYISKLKTSYAGSYKEYNSISWGAELIFAPIKSFALDLFSDYKSIPTDSRTNNIAHTISYGVGVYFYNSEEKSKVNFGIYYKWAQDETHSSKIGSVGIKASIPITPL